jgi:homoserine acetyltransferase
MGNAVSVPVDRLVVFAAPAATSAQAIAWNTAQRMAIEADHRWHGGHFAKGEEPVDGLAAAARDRHDHLSLRYRVR